MIASGYDLPFSARVIGVHSNSVQRVRVRVRIGNLVEGSRIATCIDLFGRLASAGALSGDGVAPWESEFTAQSKPTDPGLHEYEVVCRLPSQAWVVLVHLLARDAPFTVLSEVLVSGFNDAALLGISRSPSGNSTYPRVYSPLTFTLDDQNPEGGTYNFYVRLQSNLTERSECSLNEWLSAWVDSVQAGGYALAPTDSASDYVEPHSSGVDAYGSVLEWTVYKLRADPVAAIRGVVNIFAKFDHCCQRIEMLEIG